MLLRGTARILLEHYSCFNFPQLTFLEFSVFEWKMLNKVILAIDFSTMEVISLITESTRILPKHYSCFKALRYTLLWSFAKLKVILLKMRQRSSFKALLFFQIFLLLVKCNQACFKNCVLKLNRYCLHFANDLFHNRVSFCKYLSHDSFLPAKCKKICRNLIYARNYPNRSTPKLAHFVYTNL